jgi:Ran GTPase-activating protein (RanGAP) involved in mRNA processing and transport
LRHNAIGNEGAISLADADAIKSNSSFVYLDLCYNSIGNEGAISLSDAIKSNSSLVHLDLGVNSIGNEGAISLASAINQNSSLVHLNLYRNSIGNESISFANSKNKFNLVHLNYNLRNDKKYLIILYEIKIIITKFRKHISSILLF